jgi:hypothetical protein
MPDLPNDLTHNLTLTKLIITLAVTIVVIFFSVFQYFDAFAKKSDIPSHKQFIVRTQLNETKYEILLTILRVKASEFEDIIAGGRLLTPIEENRYNKIVADIARYQDRLEKSSG